MNTQQKTQIINGLEEDLEVYHGEPGRLEDILGKRMPSMSSVVKTLESTDLNIQSDNYTSLMDQEAEELISMLRHRATMLRQRAEELDAIADGFAKYSNELTIKVSTFCKTAEETRTALGTMAHINPTKVTNGE